MNKKIIGLIVGLILIISSVLIFIFSFSTEILERVGDEENQGYATNDILDEIDESILDEDDEIEIGEMV